MPSVTEKQGRFMDAEFERLRDSRKTIRERLLEAKRAADRRREPRSSPTTVLLRRLRFGSEWL